MAFLAGPAIVGALESLGVLGAAVETGAVITETAGLGAAVGSNAARVGVGAGVAAAANAVGGAVEEGVDSIFGQGTAASIENRVNDAVNDAKDALSSFFTGDIEGYKLRLKQKQDDARRYQEALNARQQEIDEQNRFFENYRKTAFDNTQASMGLVVNNLSIDNKAQDLTPMAQDIEKTKQIANDLGELLTKDLSQNLGLDPVEGLNSFDITHPLAESVLGYALDVDVKDFIPTDDLYKQISQVYNGRRIVKESVFREPRNDGSGLSIYAAFEEDGNPVVYYEHTDGLKLRPIWPGHVFTGPNSPNINDLPRDLWDTFSLYHDASYQEFGWFDRVGDYKYISRLSQNFDRFPDIQKPMIRNTIRYFSSAGTLLSFFNNRPVNVPTPDQVNQQIEQFNQQQAGKLHFLNYVDSNIDVNEEIIKVFNDTLEEKLITESANIIQTATTNAQGGGSSMMLDYEVLRNLDVELI